MPEKPVTLHVAVPPELRQQVEAIAKMRQENVHAFPNSHRISDVVRECLSVALEAVLDATMEAIEDDRG